MLLGGVLEGSRNLGSTGRGLWGLGHLGCGAGVLRVLGTLGFQDCRQLELERHNERGVRWRQAALGGDTIACLTTGGLSVTVSIDDLKAAVERVRGAIERRAAASASTAEGKTSSFWADMLSRRGNYPDINTIMVCRRAGGCSRHRR